MIRSTRRITGVLALSLLATVAAPSGAVAADDQLDAPLATAAAAVGEPGDRVQWSGAMEPLVPARVLDTRSGNGAPVGKVGKGSVVELQVAGRGGVPGFGAGAVALNVTATGSTSSGYLTVWPTGAARPLASSVNLVGGRTVANTVIAKVGRDGRVSIFNSNGSTHLVADITGWFPEGGGVEPLVPARILDTRSGTRTPLAPGATRTLTVTGAGGVPASGVSAVVLNVTATEPTAGGYLTLWPTGQARPGTSNVNFVRGQTVPNAVVAKVGANGRISIFNSSGSTHVIVDVAGWFPASGGIEPIVPARLLDTRSGVGAPAGALGPATHLSFRATGRGGVPASGVSAVVLNVTSTRSTAESYLTVWPAGSPRPLASSLNFARGQNVPNLVVAKVGDGGEVSVFNNAGSSHVLADVVAWFPDGAGVPTTVIQPYTDTVVAGSGDVVARSGDSMTGGTTTLSASADVPSVGDPFLAMPGGAAGDGVVGTVTSVVPGASGTSVVTYAPTDIGSVLADFEESYEGPLESGAAAAVTGPLAAAGAGGGGWDFSPFDGIECTGSAGTQITGIDFDMTGLGAVWDVDLSDRRVHFAVTGTPVLTTSVSASGGFSCTYSQSVGNWPIGSLWIEPSLQLSLTGTFDGDLTATASAPVTLGFTSDDGGRNLSSANLAGSANFDTDELGGTVAVDVAVSLAARLFGRVGVEGSFGMGLTGSLDPAEQPCVTVAIAPVIGFGVTVDLWLADWNFAVAEFVGEPVTLYSANPDPPCAVPDTPVWTGSVTVESHESTVYGYHDLSFTLSPRPRPKGEPGYDLYQAAHVTGSSSGGGECGDTGGGSMELHRTSGSYEDAYELTYPYGGGVGWNPGGFFRLEIRQDPFGIGPDEVDISGIFSPDNHVMGSVRGCDTGWEPAAGPIQSAFWVLEAYCVELLVEGIRSEIATTGAPETLQGSASGSYTYVPPFVEGSASCAVTWQLTSLPDPDGDGIPG